MERFVSNFILHSRCESVDYQYIIHSKTWRNGYQGVQFSRRREVYFKYWHWHWCGKREKVNEWEKFQNWLNVFVSEKWRIFSCLTKLLTDEIFQPTKHNPDERFTDKVPGFYVRYNAEHKIKKLLYKKLTILAFSANFFADESCG